LGLDEPPRSVGALEEFQVCGLKAGKLKVWKNLNGHSLDGFEKKKKKN
jgi:hypothetical protein